MTLWQFIKMCLLVVFPVVAIAAMVAVAICLIFTNKIVMLIVAIPAACVIAFGMMKWTEFIDDNDWI